VRELEDGQTFAILPNAGWWIFKGTTVGLGQDLGGVLFLVWGTSFNSVWTPCPRGTTVVINAVADKGPPHVAYALSAQGLTPTGN